MAALRRTRSTFPGKLKPLQPKVPGRLEGKSAVITGGDSGIGRAVAIAFAREGADVLISHLDEDEDAKDTARLVEEAGRKAVLVGRDLSKAEHCRELIAKAVSEFGKVDVLVSNAAYQMSHESLDEISDEEWNYTLDTNLSALFHLAKAAVPHMPAGGSIIGSSSVNSDMPSPTLAPYAATKAAIANFTASLAAARVQGHPRQQRGAGTGVTPLIPATMPPEKVESFGKDVPLGRPAQPAELAPVYVLLASDEGSYISGAGSLSPAATPFCKRRILRTTPLFPAHHRPHNLAGGAPWCAAAIVRPGFDHAAFTLTGRCYVRRSP